MKTNEFNTNFDTSNVLTLISKIHSEAADYLQVKLKDLGLAKLASSHGNILYRLSLEDKITMSDLAKLVNRDKSTITVLVRKLEQNGFVEKITSTEDARVSYIRLSQKGKDFTKGTNEISRSLMETCYRNFSESEKESLLSLLLKVSGNFTKELEKDNFDKQES